VDLYGGVRDQLAYGGERELLTPGFAKECGRLVDVENQPLAIPV
jgi:hypothetical protein